MGERSYHFETKDRDKGNERNIGPYTCKHSHTAQLDGGHRLLDRQVTRAEFLNREVN